ncbi:MAG: hypothetical protein ACI4SM_03410 [Candidatus Gastranaerophilaceae bacterium]
MKYKKGDLVIVKDWDNMCEEYSHEKNKILTGLYPFTKGMVKHCNKLFEVKGVYNFYYILNTNDDYVFTDEMLLPYNNEESGNSVTNNYYVSSEWTTNIESIRHDLTYLSSCCDRSMYDITYNNYNDLDTRWNVEYEWNSER